MSDQIAESLTYEELLSNLLLNDEIIIEISVEDVERVKIGMKNIKTRKNKKMKEEGLATEDARLEFEAFPSETYGYVNLRIFHTKRGSVAIKNMIIPTGEF
ncbi:MAG: hypothetical protein ACD_86C00003G0008 [uncultured bacterium]|nr:MAG: hypothetical protein ACD_86C00003G0008 [uncultured bacterium]